MDERQIESLRERVVFLIDFLESSSQVKEDLESRIRDAAYAARDLIESSVAQRLILHAKATKKTTIQPLKEWSFDMDAPMEQEAEEAQVSKQDMDSIKQKAKKFAKKLFAPFTSHRRNQSSKPRLTTESISKSEERCSTLFQVIQEMDFIKTKAMELKELNGGVINRLETFRATNQSTNYTLTSNNTMVGFNEYLTQVMDWLIGHQTNLVIIPIVGMGGIGKTTLARNVYDNQYILEHFYLRAWVTISQEYSFKIVLSTILYSVCDTLDRLLKQESSPESLEEFISRMNGRSEDQIGEELYKCLCGMRYFIALDDVWSIEVWESLKSFFPDNDNGSRIVLTTRLSNVAGYFNGNFRLEMRFLDEEQSWSLIKERVFVRGDHCPPELVEIGKEISRVCGGLPLSLIVISALLVKSEKTLRYWKYVAKNLRANMINSENDGHCLKILSLSYSHLPVHLKPCFLYLSIFPEDHDINVSELIKLWVSEGLLKPYGDKSLEEVAEDGLNELIDRNLVLVHKRGSRQNIKMCKMHDLLRDICLKEFHNEKFQCVTKRDNFRNIFEEMSPILVGKESQKDVMDSVNIRYLDFTPSLMDMDLDRYDSPILFRPPVPVLWNLQTIIIKNTSESVAPPGIWEMPQLRHAKFGLVALPDPLGYGCALKNLQTLQKIKNFRFSEEAIKKIPNIKKLKIQYIYNRSSWESIMSYMSNMSQLRKLESLSCSLRGFGPSRYDDCGRNLVLPCSLKRLTLSETRLDWNDMSRFVGSLPKLEVLKLCWGSTTGETWDLTDHCGESFVSLKYLWIEHCSDLRYWKANETHFPSLASLILVFMNNLEEIPSGFGDIPTLRFIKLDRCSDSAVISAKNIMEYQESFGIEDLRVEVQLWYRSTLEISTGKNFSVRSSS